MRREGRRRYMVVLATDFNQDQAESIKEYFNSDTTKAWILSRSYSHESGSQALFASFHHLA